MAGEDYSCPAQFTIPEAPLKWVAFLSGSFVIWVAFLVICVNNEMGCINWCRCGKVLYRKLKMEAWMWLTPMFSGMVMNLLLAMYYSGSPLSDNSTKVSILKIYLFFFVLLIWFCFSVLFWGEIRSCTVHKDGTKSRALPSSAHWTICLCRMEFWVQ